MTWTSRHISVRIDRPAQDVYAFASAPENLPKWAGGLSGSIERVGGDWVADSPMGRVTIRFAESNPFGVLDHDVTVSSGQTFHNPMRVFPNEEGCEVVFTLFRRPGMSDEEFDRDATTVARDLETLKRLMEA